MKKITFILFALIAGTTFAQNTDTKDAQVFAEIVEPLIITKSVDLNFGRIIGGTAGGGTVTIKTDGTGRTIDSNLDAPGGTVNAAEFEITASSYTYNITYTPTKLIDAASVGVDMLFTPDSNLGSSASGNQTLVVGGDLLVAADQAAGSYEGTVTVKVDYN